jgi:putative alpha-1,2-mannosidase
VIGAPLFRKVTLHLENGKNVVIEAPANSDEKLYVNKITFNGQPYTKEYFDHFDLSRGAIIRFDMQATPNKTRVGSEADRPFSLSARQ